MGTADPFNEFVGCFLSPRKSRSAGAKLGLTWTSNHEPAWRLSGSSSLGLSAAHRSSQTMLVLCIVGGPGTGQQKKPSPERFDGSRVGEYRLRKCTGCNGGLLNAGVLPWHSKISLISSHQLENTERRLMCFAEEQEERSRGANNQRSLRSWTARTVCTMACHIRCPASRAAGAAKLARGRKSNFRVGFCTSELFSWSDSTWQARQTVSGRWPR